MNDVLLVPATYFALVTVEGQFITPILTGRSLTLNPVMIFLSMLLWGWIWGVIGALMAVPILMTLKIFCDHVESLHGWASFLLENRAGRSRTRKPCGHGLCRVPRRERSANLSTVRLERKDRR